MTAGTEGMAWKGVNDKGSRAGGRGGSVKRGEIISGNNDGVSVHTHASRQEQDEGM